MENEHYMTLLRIDMKLHDLIGKKQHETPRRFSNWHKTEMFHITRTLQEHCRNIMPKTEHCNIV